MYNVYMIKKMRKYFDMSFTTNEASAITGVNLQKIITWGSRKFIDVERVGSIGKKMKLNFNFMSLFQLELLRLLGEYLGMGLYKIEEILHKDFEVKTNGKEKRMQISDIIKLNPSPSIPIITYEYLPDPEMPSYMGDTFFPVKFNENPRRVTYNQKDLNFIGEGEISIIINTEIIKKNLFIKIDRIKNND